MDRSKDTTGLALLLGGVALAAATALFLPVVHFRGADQALLGLSAWQAVPLVTLLKFALLGAALAAAFLPRLQPLRIPITVAAITMMFMPALAALVAGVYQWSDVREAIVALSGNRSPWVDPGWGIVALGVAALMLVGALVRGNRAATAPA
jgi:hypothetical protein